REWTLLERFGSSPVLSASGSALGFPPLEPKTKRKTAGHLRIEKIKEMLTRRAITFVVASNNSQILKDNLLASPCFRGPNQHQVLGQERFQFAAKSYHEANGKSHNDLIVFVHQDVILPEIWVADLERALSWLAVDDPRWGVLGCRGETLEDNGWGH